MQMNITIEEMLASKAKLKILKYLFASKAAMSENEISKIIHLSHMTVNRIMKELQALNLAFSERAGNALLWKLNKDSYAYQVLSPIITQIAKATTPQKHLIKTMLKLIPLKIAEKIILFGSIATGEEKPSSDIDLFIQVKNAKVKNQLRLPIDKLSDVCLNRYGNKLSPYILTGAELKKRPATLLAEIEKGKQLYP
jgi:predicted nucleotidyltransferase